MQLGPDLIYRPNLLILSKKTKNPGSLARNKKYGDQALINAFQNFLQIEPDVFEGLVLDGRVSNTPIQNQKKCVPRKKNITKSV